MVMAFLTILLRSALLGSEEPHTFRLAATASLWPQCVCIRPSLQVLTCYSAKLRSSILAPAETFHFAVGISRGATTRLCGTLDLAQIIRRAKTHPALDVPISIPHRAASR